jgi:hypothetical protein
MGENLIRRRFQSSRSEEYIMLNMEGISTEAKIGKILILVGIIIGILVAIGLGFITTLIWMAGSVSGMGVSVAIPLWILSTIIILKIIGLAFGFLALFAAEKNDYNRAGIYAIISCVVPPLDLIMLIGGIFCLIGREANEKKMENNHLVP